MHRFDDGERLEGRLEGGMKLRVFGQCAGAGAPRRMEDWEAIQLSVESIAAAGALPPPPASVLVLGIEVTNGAVAAALVPDSLSGVISRNGVPMVGGLRLLHHGDLLELCGNRLWINGERTATEEPYDPEAHGEGIRCARTKAILHAGEGIVRCPGVARRAVCGLIYKSAAWELNTRCHGCGHDPARAAWEPPQTPETESLDAYFDQLLRS